MPPTRTPARIGCAGWSIPRAHAHNFPRGASVLERYAQVFDAVEINATFCRTPRMPTFQRWADSVPDGFRFSLKLPRTLTHYARLQADESHLDAFLANAAPLGGKLGAVLAQLPPSLAFEAKVVERFFATLRARVGSQVVVACEPRHASWGQDIVGSLLTQLGVTRVAADPPRFVDDALPAGTEPAYWRWHGSPRIYYDRYGEGALARLAKALRRTPGSWAVFDNTASGHATGDALRLHALLGLEPPVSGKAVA
ncbi:MAG TPA: DUF72 domain-containing protein [Thermomonas sp.]|nr:DUF72 domain-containing protein [Thermomonas sp.]